MHLAACSSFAEVSFKLMRDIERLGNKLGFHLIGQPAGAGMDVTGRFSMGALSGANGGGTGLASSAGEGRGAG